MSNIKPTLEERMRQAEGYIPGSFIEDQSDPPLPDENTVVIEKKKDELGVATQPRVIDDNERSRSMADFFVENMSAKEIMDYYVVAVKESNEPVIMNIIHDNKPIQIEGIKEADNRKEFFYDTLDSLDITDQTNGICVYIDGEEVNPQTFTEFINENKAEFVAACNLCFPNMAEIALAKQEDLTLAEKEHVLKIVNRAEERVFVKQEPATEEKLSESKKQSVQKQQKILKTGREEMRYAQDHLYDSGPKVNAQFYIQDEEKLNIVEFSKFTLKDGSEKESMKLNGKYVNNHVMENFLSKNPGQIKEQVDTYLKAQKSMQEKKKSQTNYKKKSVEPER